MLGSLPRAEYVSGLAEVIKAGFIADPAILELIEADPAGAVIPHGRPARGLVERAVRMKADVVSGDLREAGRRDPNYGHTLGHAIERVEGYEIRHGEAVAIGMVFAAEVARLAGRLDAGTVARHRRVLKSVAAPPSTAQMCGPTCARPCQWTRRPAAPGSGWSCWTGSPGPARWMRHPRTCCAGPTGR